MPAYPLSGELSRRRLGTESGALRREARAISRAGGNPQKFLEAASQAKLQAGGSISSAEENKTVQERRVQAQSILAREQDGLVKEMRGGTSGGVLRSAASGTNVQESGTNTPVSGANAPARMTPREPLGAMQSVAAPPTNQAKADIEQYGLDEAIKRYYQRSADADAAKTKRREIEMIDAESKTAAGIKPYVFKRPEPTQIPEESPTLAATLEESAAVKQRVAARRSGTLRDLEDVPDMMNQAVRQARPVATVAAPTGGYSPLYAGPGAGYEAGAEVRKQIGGAVSATTGVLKDTYNAVKGRLKPLEFQEFKPMEKTDAVKRISERNKKRGESVDKETSGFLKGLSGL